MARATAKASKKSSKMSTAESPIPSRRSCACVQAHMGLLDRYPEFRTNQSRLEHYTRGYMQSGDHFRIAVTKVPVVVHVVHKKAAEKISVAQVKSQITAMNKDFRATNHDKSKIPAPFKSLHADTFIEFSWPRKTRMAKIPTESPSPRPMWTPSPTPAIRLSSPAAAA